MDMTRQTAPENDRGERQGAFSLLGTASTMGLHMVSGPVVGTGLGWLIDDWVGSWPIASAIGFFLGVWAGFRNVWSDARYLARSNAANDAADTEKAAAEKKSDIKKIVKEPSDASSQFVPEENKLEEACQSPSRRAFVPDPLPQDEALKDEESDLLTASILAGTAMAGEKGLEEQDETMEAIRRVLKQGVEQERPGKIEGEGARPSGEGE